MTPRAMLESGPAKAIQNSSPADDGSRVRFDTPPNTYNVIVLTGRPRACATKEWLSSWIRTETNSSSAAATATAQYSPSLQCLKFAGKYPVASDHATRANISSQDQLINNRMPRILPIGRLPLMPASGRRPRIALESQ